MRKVQCISAITYSNPNIQIYFVSGAFYHKRYVSHNHTAIQSVLCDLSSAYLNLLPTCRQQLS
jgi:hypothetical protein